MPSKESDAQALKIEAVTEKLANLKRAQGKSRDVRALKEQLKGLVAAALQSRRMHDREIQQVSRQLLNRANAFSAGGRGEEAAADPTQTKHWAKLMARIDFMPQGLRALVQARVSPVLETEGIKAAFAAVDKVEQEYLRKIWKETQGSEENSIQEALDLVHSVARMQPDGNEEEETEPMRSE